MSNSTRSGSIVLIIAISAAISLVLTTAYSTSVNKKLSRTVSADTLRCGTQGGKCCEVKPSSEAESSNWEVGRKNTCKINSESKLVCNFDNQCASTCGNENESCCLDMTIPYFCREGLSCNPKSGLCSSCGSEGLRCCSGSICNAGFACDSNVCKVCGGVDQPCCGDNVCNGGLACKSGKCGLPAGAPLQTGGPGEPCNADSSCDSENLYCDVGMPGSSSTCRSKQPGGGGGAQPPGGVVNEAPCSNAGGACQGAASAGASCTVGATAGTYQRGLCPTQASDVMCCVPSTAGGGGTQPPTSPNPPPVQQILGGKVQKADSGEGLAGVSVTVAAVDKNGQTVLINGQATYTTTTDAAGDWAAEVPLSVGDGYAVRPQSVGPAGYETAPRTSNDTHSEGAHLNGQNTPLNEQSYEQQIVGKRDCASTPGWPKGACNFVYSASAQEPDPKPAGGQDIANKACVAKQEVPPIVKPPGGGTGNQTTKKDMKIVIKLFLPLGAAGTPGAVPSISVLPTELVVTNGAIVEDSEAVTLELKYVSDGVWQAEYDTSHIPGSRFSVSVWPHKFAKKTFCHSGANSPHFFYGEYLCSMTEGTISLVEGENVLDFTKTALGVGDIDGKTLRDGLVDSQDLYAISSNLRQNDDGSRENLDLNLDGGVTMADYELAVWTIQHIAN